MKKAIQYGAGNIGRGFLAQLFTLSGYEVVFIDVNSEIVNKLNKDKSHTIALGLQKRWAAKNMQPFNIIICENLLHADKFMADLIKKNLSGQEFVIILRRI